MAFSSGAILTTITGQFTRLAGSRISILHRYLIRQFLSALILSLAASTTLFLVFDLFERMKTFLKEEATLLQVLSYLAFKIPLILTLMTPIAVMVAVLVSVGRMSQLSEITAMRACGASIFWLATPLFFTGLLISSLVFFGNETIVPWAERKVSDIYRLDVKKHLEKGKLSRADFWYRTKNRFFKVDLYDSRENTMNGITIFELDKDFRLARRFDAAVTRWRGPIVGWVMDDVTEISTNSKGSYSSAHYPHLPLLIDEKPADFYNLKLEPDTMSSHDLRHYIRKLKSDGVPTTQWKVRLAAKASFPLLSAIVVLVVFPFALIPARSGRMTLSFVIGLSIGFGYYIVHAICSSLGTAELIPVYSAAWAANVFLLCIGGWFLTEAEMHR